ncbi:hypothetical protein NX059_001229 [Plenodomus lindquistii]|nr:hypothetical protein NX059_001229 [Plenodomus lindquistii]
MPLLAAQTWAISRAAAGPVAAARRRAMAATRRRCYSQHTGTWPADEQRQPNGPYDNTHKRGPLTGTPPQLRPARFEAATLIPHSVKQDDRTLLRHIRDLGQNRHWRKFAVVLVTPAFAHKLHDNDFMGKLVYRIFARALPKDAKRLVDVLCAVVDKLPAGRPIAQAHELAEADCRNVDVPVAPAGYEGFSYAVLPIECSLPSDVASASPGPGAIDFVVSAAPSQNTVPYEVLRLPLANTVFQTGTPTTMALLRYESNKGQGPRLQLVSRTPLSHHQVLISTRPYGLVNSLSIPLIPLTRARHVNECMGNIIRRIIDHKGNQVTAASELELAVPKFFQARGEPAQATVAWALIVPEKLHSFIKKATDDWLEKNRENETDPGWETLWRSDPPVWTTAVSNAIARGARLHRVLSGGGGWGQKAGLISLDPVPVNVPSQSSSLDAMSSTPADPKDFASTLTPVVNEGDLMQFFIQPASHLTATAKRDDTLERLKSLPETSTGGWEIGTIPSTVDRIPGQSWQHAGPESTGASEFRNVFGALTEGPLTLTRRIWENGAFTEATSTTTVDVPFTRFWKLSMRTYREPKENGHEDALEELHRDVIEDVGERRIAE